MCHSREGGRERGIGRFRFRSASKKIQERRCFDHGDRCVLADETFDNFLARSRSKIFTLARRGGILRARQAREHTSGTVLSLLHALCRDGTRDYAQSVILRNASDYRIERLSQLCYLCPERGLAGVNDTHS